jgi:hypothetical protein
LVSLTLVRRQSKIENAKGDYLIALNFGTTLLLSKLAINLLYISSAPYSCGTP